LRVISVPPFLQQVIPTAIAKRLSRNPQLSVRLDVARRIDLADWINRRDFDLAVVGLPVDRPEVSIHPLPSVEAVAVLPRAHALAGQQRIALRQLVAGPLVAHSSGPMMRFELDRALAAQGLPSVLAVEAPTAWLVCALVRAGAGLAVVDPLTAVAQVGNGLVARRLKEKIMLKYGIMTLRERTLMGEAATLAHVIKEEMALSLKSLRLKP
jgi:DNA-binding transcriptional LysR family regulator